VIAKDDGTYDLRRRGRDDVNVQSLDEV
jgi:hypothetical protein